MPREPNPSRSFLKTISALAATVVCSGVVFSGVVGASVLAQAPLPQQATEENPPSLETTAESLPNPFQRANPLQRDRGEAEATSLLGDLLFPPELPPKVQLDRLAKLRDAQSHYHSMRSVPESWIWLGRRTAYLARYREAIFHFSGGIGRFPQDARFRRHRGHRWITTRNFEQAVHDLRKAAELVEGQEDQVEPDGLPNSRGVPTSTLQSNIHYHLGLAFYLQGDFEAAHSTYLDALAVSKNPDMLVATSHWLYMTLRRLGRSQDAAKLLEGISPNMDIIENQTYHRLLLFYKGEISEQELLGHAEGDSVGDATLAYGLANWYLYSGKPEAAVERFGKIVELPRWDAFGYIAAEAELARSRESSKPGAK